MQFFSIYLQSNKQTEIKENKIRRFIKQSSKNSTNTSVDVVRTKSLLRYWIYILISYIFLYINNAHYIASKLDSFSAKKISQTKWQTKETNTRIYYIVANNQYCIQIIHIHIKPHSFSLINQFKTVLTKTKEQKQ